MLKDITLGQFFPGQSAVHRVDPRFKIVYTLWFIVMVFTASTPCGYALVFLFLLYTVLISKISVKLILKSLKPILIFMIFTAVLNLLYARGETVLWSWKFITITQEGLLRALYMVLRIMFLVAGTSMLTYTTSPTMLTDGVERLFKPLAKLRFPVHELAMMMTIALRFIPILIEETDKIMSAQRARGADFESGNLLRRAKALVPLLVPLFVSAFRRADELALAMECRCYRGGEGRTKYRAMKAGGVDLAAGLVMLAIQVGIILLGRFGI
ncbi:MAG: energy-coupling factor transporter transmembrane protein EcfT [Clostridia bacterium]|nr:energy-coupling factor transporter transmembrane protein EcfT [Clostridia bacterium]